MLFSITSMLRPWYRALGLARQNPASWHISRLHEEKQELLEAATTIEKLSEESDVFFAISRATYDGYTIASYPQPPFLANFPRNVVVYAYMIGKYSSRCAFYATAARFCGAENWMQVSEVVNPGKEEKVRVVAERWGICPDKFQKVCGWLRWVWPLFP